MNDSNCKHRTNINYQIIHKLFSIAPNVLFKHRRLSCNQTATSLMNDIELKFFIISIYLVVQT